MSKVGNELVSQTSLTPVTRADMESLQAQRLILKEFISSQLKEANFSNSDADDYGDGDFGAIPGTKKKSLLKPGAEKLLQLFGLGVRFKVVDKEIDRHANFAMYTFEAEVYRKTTGHVVSTCLGIANSQEVKYRERTVWVAQKNPDGTPKKRANGSVIKESKKEETPIFDIINTLSKMAQKRALVGATILATAASDFFTQDMEMDEVLPAEGAAPKDVTGSAPKAEAQAQAPANSDEAPVCCGRKMIISKFPDRETGETPFYCLSCKSKVPQGAA